ncbi:Uncharacterised protein [Acinetobacter baumannii]|nr:Uncharacterised protein [Acinetobacter baumannii]
MTGGFQAAKRVAHRGGIDHVAGSRRIDVARQADGQALRRDPHEVAAAGGQALGEVVEEVFFHRVVVLRDPGALAAVRLLDPQAVAALVVVLRRDEVVDAFQGLQIRHVLAVLVQIGKLRGHADDEVLALPGVVLAHQLEGRRQHPLVVGQVDGALLEVDVQAVETVGFHQTDDLGGQRLLLPGVQLDVRVGAPQRNQHRAALGVEHADLAAKLRVGQVVWLEGRDAAPFHEGHGDHVVLARHVFQRDVGERALLVAVGGAGRPVVPEAHENLLAGDARHGRRGIFAGLVQLGKVDPDHLPLLG